MTWEKTEKEADRVCCYGLAPWAAASHPGTLGGGTEHMPPVGRGSRGIYPPIRTVIGWGLLWWALPLQLCGLPWTWVKHAPEARKGASRKELQLQVFAVNIFGKRRSVKEDVDGIPTVAPPNSLGIRRKTTWQPPFIKHQPFPGITLRISLKISLQKLLI